MLDDAYDMIHGMYVAVRDKNWETVPYHVVRENIKRKKDGIEIETSLRFLQKPISYEAIVTFLMSSNGSIKYSFEGKALSAFLKNRIGINVLLPIRQIPGKPFQVVHTDNAKSAGAFPQKISPHQPVIDIKKLSWENGSPVSLYFTGDSFEMEDQRNWTDASYKIYSTPLSLPFPVQVHQGESCNQAVEVVIAPEKTSSSVSSISRGEDDTPGKCTLPKIGVTFTNEVLPVNDIEQELIRLLNPDFLAYTCDITSSNWSKDLNRAFDLVRHVNRRLKLALWITQQNTEHDQNTVLQELLNHRNQIYGIEVYDKYSFISSGNYVVSLVNKLKNAMPEVVIGGGTYAYYAELNRAEEIASSLEFISFTISPQVHAFDDLSLLENLYPQEIVTVDARKKTGKPVQIGAVTLPQRLNFVSTGKEGSHSMTSNIPTDSRQSSVFGALWTLGSIVSLSKGAAEAVTYFQLFGQHGIMKQNLQTKADSEVYDTEVERYPVYDVLKEIFSLGTREIIPINSNKPESYGGFQYLEANNKAVYWLWNYTDTDIYLETLDIPVSKNNYSEKFNFHNHQWTGQTNVGAIEAFSFIRLFSGDTNIH